MTQRGHVLDDNWYLDYASGALPGEAYRVLVESHAELSPPARDRLTALEAIGGELLDTCVSDECGAEALSFSADDVLAREGDAVAPTVTRADVEALSKDGEVLPGALKDFMARHDLRLKWSYLGPGMRKAVLWRGENGEHLWLLKARGGVSIPQHGHNGSELTLVLKGSFWDGDQQYLPGDVEEAHGGVEHDIVIDPSEECICLALTEGRLRFENPILRAFQLFTGL
ncbi:ChrR family anti-sigma-E factor [Maricaulis sp. CAU 1757]